MPTVILLNDDGTRREFQLPAGISLMQAAKGAGVDIEASCEGSLACATCHIALSAEWYARLGPPQEDEDAMLDILAFLEPTSRLSCQIRLTEDMNGLTFKVVE